LDEPRWGIRDSILAELKSAYAASIPEVDHTVAMALEIASDIAAYGLFQIAFASLDTRIARCLVKLCGCQNAGLAFSAFKRQPFGRRLQTIRKAMKSVAAVPSLSEEVRDLKRACDIAQSVSEWRNERIHAEVRFTDEGQPVIVDADGHRLHFDVDACESKIRDSIHAGIAMETIVPSLAAYQRDLAELMDD
jgi:hypothetical protein